MKDDNSHAPASGGNGSIYRTLIDNLPQRIFLKDPNSVYVLCNEAYAKDLKLRPENLEGRTDYDFFPVELADKYRRDDKRALKAGLTEEFDEEYVHNGEKRTIHTVKIPVRDAAGRQAGILGIFWDVTESLRAREALQESETRFHSIFTNVSDLVLLLKLLPSGAPIIQDVSESVVKLLGFSRNELVGRPISVLDPELTASAPEIAESIISDRRKAAAEGRSFVVKHTCKDGTVREFECSANLCAAGRENLAISVERDISERLRTETELRFRAELLDNATDAIHALELDGRIIYVNETVVRTTGYSREELLGMNVSRLDSPADAELAQGRLRRLFADGAGRFRLLRVRKDGSSFPVEAYARVASLGDKKLIIAVDRDITELERSEAEMRESYEIQHALNDILRQSLTPLPLQKKLSAHLAVLFSIPWLAVEPRGAIFLSGGDSLVLTAQQGLAPELLAACARLPFGKCLCGKAAKSGETITSSCVNSDHDISYEGIAQHGHYCAPILASGKVLGVVNLYLKEGVVVNGKRLDFLKAVSDILAADILRSRVEEQLVHSQKMEAIGHVAGGVAHDFNNILSAIMGYASFLGAGIPAGDPRRADLEEILKAGERATGLTRQLLAFSRKQVISSTALDLDAVVPEVVKMIRRIVAENIEFVTALASAPAKVLANQGQLEQVLLNLAVNARDAMPGGGKLTFETALVALGENYTAGDPEVLPGRYVMLAVSDTGAGMSPEIKARIFEPFFTTKEQGKGTGLGLSTVYGIVKQSGGNIYVYSEPGKGTTFKLYFPVAGTQEPVKEEARPATAPHTGTGTLLLVEDDEPVRRFLARLLTQNGYTVLEADSPDAALELCGERRDIRLMLTDMIMPRMNGFELARAVAERAPGVKVIFMSGYTDNALAGMQGAAAQGITFLEKPLNSDIVLQKVRDALAQ
ncbi:MAG: PAS domain S-box protein [Elusimicrobia bacterium]|nr:PAS domain S-box protein [Elusimicrobiota bacterium]